MFSNFARDMLGCISSKSSLVLRGSFCLPFLYCNRWCATSYWLLRRFTIDFNNVPVLLKIKDKRRTLYSMATSPVGLVQHLPLSRPRPMLTRYLSVFCHPSFQYFTLQSTISNLSLSSFEQRRYKTSKKSPKRPEYDSDSDTDDEEPIQGTKVLTIRSQSLRTDGVLKKALNVARNKVETAFYEGNIRVNGEKPSKKSHQLQIGDEVDLIRGISPVNPDLLSISRVEILSVEEDEDQLSVKIRRTKSLYIENYNTDPWKKGTTE